MDGGPDARMHGFFRPGTYVRRLRYEVRGLIEEHPRVYLPLARLKHNFYPGAVAVSRQTDILIEGFPRSGNSFAVTAFRLAQQRPVAVAHHFHAPAQIMAAARWGVPTLLLLRDPEDAVLSQVLRCPFLTVRQALKAYVRFYRRLQLYSDRYVLASFESVTNDFGKVIRRVNEKFGTEFEEFAHTPANVERCFEIMEETNRRLFGKGEIIETMVSRPSERRAGLKAKPRREFWKPRLARLRKEARRTHASYLSGAPP